MLFDTGLLIISSPYTWKPEHTNPDNWIGGLEREGRELTTKEVTEPSSTLTAMPRCLAGDTEM